MIHSMTGYGKGESKARGFHYQVELKTVNNRYLEAGLKLPSGLWQFEAEARALAGQVLTRGKLDMTWRDLAEADLKERPLAVDEKAAAAQIKAFKGLAKMLRSREKPSPGWVARQPGVIKEAAADQESAALAKGRWECFRAAMEKALASLKETRAREGAVLEKELEKWLDSSLQLVSSVEAQSGELVKLYRERLASRMSELLEKFTPDDPRLVMEAALLADRTDIREELVRFRSHVDEFRRLLSLPEAPGKRLDFLCQELLREANTMGSKSPDARIAHQVVELKGNIEKIREQALNVE